MLLLFHDMQSSPQGEQDVTMIRKQVYDSVQEMVTAADKAFQAGRRQRDDDAIRSDVHFLGRSFDGWGDVVAKVGDYWPEGLDLVQEMLFELRNVTGQARPKSRVRHSRWSADDGDEIDMDRLRAGQDCWRQTVREERDAPQTLCLVFSLSTSASYGSDEVLWRGAVAIVLADLLEACGYRVELWAVSYGRHAYYDGSDAFVAAKLKGSASPLDIAALVNGIAGWFYRTVVFQSYHVPLRARSSRTVIAIHEGMPAIIELAGNARVVTIDNVWDRSAAVAKVQEVMNRLH
jgi:hypothetical protein